MPRQRKAWLTNGTGIRKGLPGFYVEWHERAGGRRVHRSRHFRRIADARRFVKQYNARLELGLLGQVVPISLRDAAAEFAAGLGPLSRATVNDYMTTLGFLGGFLGEFLGGPEAPLSAVSAGHLERFIAQRLRRSTEATVAKHIRNLRRFFNWAVRRNYLTQNPVGNLTTRPSDTIQRKRPVVEDATLGRLIDALQHEDQKIAVWLAMTTGLDRGVIDCLCSAWVDVETQTIRVQRPKTRRKGVQSLVVPIHPVLWPLIERRLDRIAPTRPILSGLGRRYEGRDWWDAAARAAGCPGLLFRDLRAVAASRSQRLAGLSLADTQRLLGHSSPTVTARHYTMPDPDAVRRLNALPLPGAPSKPGGMEARLDTSGRPASQRDIGDLEVPASEWSQPTSPADGQRHE